MQISEGSQAGNRVCLWTSLMSMSIKSRWKIAKCLVLTVRNISSHFVAKHIRLENWRFISWIWSVIKWRLVVTGNIRGLQEERICRLSRIFHDTTIGDSSFGLYLIANEWLMWGWVVGWWTRRQLQGGVLLSISSNINTLSYWLNTLGRGMAVDNVLLMWNYVQLQWMATEKVVRYDRSSLGGKE